MEFTLKDKLIVAGTILVCMVGLFSFMGLFIYALCDSLGLK